MRSTACRFRPLGRNFPGRGQAVDRHRFPLFSSLEELIRDRGAWQDGIAIHSEGDSVFWKRWPFGDGGAVEADYWPSVNPETDFQAEIFDGDSVEPGRLRGMKSTSAWALLCALGLVLATPHLLAQTNAVEEPYQFQEQSPEPPPRGVFLPCGAASSAEVARMRLRVELPPVPAYPPNGEIPEELQHRMVYLDEKTGELVMSYPPLPDFKGPTRDKRQ